MKRYLSSFTLPSKTDQEFALGKAVNRRTCYQNVYPFGVFGAWEETRLEMEPITILYGGNGSGKTTLLNLMGDALGLERRSVYNRAAFFQNFVDLCQWEGGAPDAGGQRGAHQRRRVRRPSGPAEPQ